MNIGGNTEAMIQLASVTKNEYGTEQHTWQDALQLTGWLDLQGTDSYKFREYSAKISETTHVFLTDYILLEKDGIEITSENSRMMIKGKIYDVLLYDNPMEMDQQLEIYLKYVGGQNGCGV